MLKEAQNIAGCGDSVVRGCEFLVNSIEPIAFNIQNCPTLYTGEKEYLFNRLIPRVPRAESYFGTLFTRWD
jgi:hypothetical protein